MSGKRPKQSQVPAQPACAPIELTDGDRLRDLLKQYELGVKTVVRPVEDVLPNHLRNEAGYLTVRQPGRGLALDWRKRAAV